MLQSIVFECNNHDENNYLSKRVQICASSEKPSAGKSCRLNRNPTEKHSVLKSWLSRNWSVRFEIPSLRCRQVCIIHVVSHSTYFHQIVIPSNFALSGILDVSIPFPFHQPCSSSDFLILNQALR